MAKSWIKKFLFPEANRKYFIRILIVAVTAFMVFKYVLIPFRIQGDSMWPTYTNGSVNFCFTCLYLFSEPDRNDVVTVRLAGNRVMLLKRIVALENDTVAFKAGKLIVNQQEVEEPYISGSCDWDLPPRKVKPGHIYVVGDNRGVPMERHHFGQTPVRRITGAPLW